MLLALLALFQQAPGLDISTSTDRGSAAVGEEIVFTLHAVGHSTAPFRADLPSLDGFRLIDRREHVDVVYGAAQVTRAYVLELHLRAEQVGTWSIGPIRVEQGNLSGFSPSETVTVSNATGGAQSGVDPGLLALVPRVPPPRAGGPSVFTLLSSDVVYAGDQVDVLTAAWLPRGLRLRLRQPPTLSPPALPGVWSTARPAVPGAVASREVDGETYDLFVGFQSVFPLNPGTIQIPEARLAWTPPSGARGGGDGGQRTAESRPIVLSVRPLPVAGRPAGFNGPIARDLRIEYRLGRSAARAGDVLSVDVVVSGAGNLPLWPEPRMAWPGGVRVYEEGTESSPRAEGTRLGGSKKFRYTVVPDSAGSLSLPPLEYLWFDPAANAYRDARAPAISVPVLDAAPTSGGPRSAVPIEQQGAPSPADRLLALPRYVLAALVAIPLLGMLGAARFGRRAPRPPRAPPADNPAERLDVLLGALVPPGSRSSAPALAGALRGAGMDREVAKRLVQLHGAIEAGRFGRNPATADPPDLLKAIDIALGLVPARLRRWGGRAAALTGGAFLLLTSRPAALAAQSGIELYGRRQYAAAAKAFASGAASARRSGVLWYDLAAAEYMSHQDAEAAAALLAARALAPRDPRVEALWNALAREHDPLRRAGPTWPLTAEESFAAGLVALWIGALLFILLRRRLPLWPLPLVLAVVAGAIGAIQRAERAAPRAVLTAGTSLRLSPHGLAPERDAVPAFSIVRLERRLGSWWLIRTGGGAEGWVSDEIVARAPALN